MGQRTTLVNIKKGVSLLCYVSVVYYVFVLVCCVVFSDATHCPHISEFRCSKRTLSSAWCLVLLACASFYSTRSFT